MTTRTLNSLLAVLVLLAFGTASLAQDRSDADAPTAHQLYQSLFLELYDARRPFDIDFHQQLVVDEQTWTLATFVGTADVQSATLTGVGSDFLCMSTPGGGVVINYCVPYTNIAQVRVRVDPFAPPPPPWQNEHRRQDALTRVESLATFADAVHISLVDFDGIDRKGL